MKKNNTYTHLNAALHFSSLAIAIFAMVFTMNSCQEEEFGFTRAEIAASASQRHYAEAFQKEFAKIDPNHTWMCTPDTVYGAQLVATRGVAGTPVVTKMNEAFEISYSEAIDALNFLREEQDNRGKCSQDFEYLATEDKYEFDIHPVFWGRKFVDTNYVGIWYIGVDDKKHDLDPFWSDAPYTSVDNNQDNGVKAHYTYKNSDEWKQVQKTTEQITDIRSNYNYRDYAPDAFQFPSYHVTVPVGMKWGLYIKTKTTQTNGQDITWYSNAEYNVNHCSAAASFTYSNINYVSFEDAPNPYNCSDKTAGHTCTNHPGENDKYSGRFGHYDHDMNDIILAITPHPIESTYRSISYRVMCEDLGGTFDWDFNDLVFDVKYVDGTGVGKATTTISVQAVGGTLPIKMAYHGQYGNYESPELHSGLFNQTPVQSEEDQVLYEPINVAGNNRGPEEAYKITHTWDRIDKFDVRDIVKDMTVIVNGCTTVRFPLEKGDKQPQCFICPISVKWSDELVNIADTYPDFRSWVALQGENPTWWNSGYNGNNTSEVKQ